MNERLIIIFNTKQYKNQFYPCRAVVQRSEIQDKIHAPPLQYNENSIPKAKTNLSSTPHRNSYRPFNTMHLDYQAKITPPVINSSPCDKYEKAYVNQIHWTIPQPSLKVYEFSGILTLSPSVFFT